MPWSKGFFNGEYAYIRATASDAHKAYRNGVTVYVANAYTPPRPIPAGVRMCDWVDKFVAYYDNARPCYYVPMDDAVFATC